MIVAAVATKPRRKTKSRPAPKTLRTGNAKSLVASGIGAAEDAASQRALVELAKSLSQTEMEFIPNDQFKQRSAALEILSPAALEETTNPAKTSWKQVREMPAHLARMCETALLKPEEERMLFRRMNYAKFRAEQLRRKLNTETPVPEMVEEVASLMQQAAADRERIVRANLRLVVSIAKKFADMRNSFDDLLSEGITSLLRAVEKFDFDRGFRFSTYATQAVRRTLCRLLQQLQRDRGRYMTAEASLFEETAEDAPVGTMTESRWHELKRALLKMLSKLDPRERAIIRRRFGLDKNDEVQTLQSLAGEMGVCKERVRQLELRAMTKLRAMAEEIHLTPPEEA